MTTLDQSQPDPGPWGMRWTIPILPADHRPDSEVCGMCCRSLLPRRAVYVHRLPICRACHSQTNDPRLVDWWLGLPRYQRRAWITVAVGIDPMDKADADVEAEYADVSENVDGIPSGVNVRTGNRAFGAGALVLPVNTFWRIWTYRGRGTHH